MDVNPIQGRIVGGEKQRFTLKICPGMPEEIVEVFAVEIGYFEPKTIKVVGKGIYPAIVSNLVRVETDVYSNKFEQEKQKLLEDEQKSLAGYMAYLDKQRKLNIDIEEKARPAAGSAPNSGQRTGGML